MWLIDLVTMVRNWQPDLLNFCCLESAKVKASNATYTHTSTQDPLILLLSISSTVRWIDHTAGLPSPSNQSQRWILWKSRADWSLSVLWEPRMSMPHSDSYSTGAASPDRRTRRSSPGFNTKFCLCLWEKRRCDREQQTALSDVNVPWLKINFLIHLRGQNLQTGKVARPIQLQGRPPSLYTQEQKVKSGWFFKGAQNHRFREQFKSLADWFFSSCGIVDSHFQHSTKGTEIKTS